MCWCQEDLWGEGRDGGSTYLCPQCTQPLLTPPSQVVSCIILTPGAPSPAGGVCKAAPRAVHFLQGVSVLNPLVTSWPSYQLDPLVP